MAESKSLKSMIAEKWEDFMGSRRNPARTLSWDKTHNHNLWEKLQHTAYFFFGDLRFVSGPNRNNHNSALPYQAGVLDYVPFFGIPKLLLEACFALWRNRESEGRSIEQPNKLLAEITNDQMAAKTSYLAKARLAIKKFTQNKPWVLYPLLFILGLVTLPLLIIQAVLALALTIAVSPIVVIVDIFAGPNMAEQSKTKDDVKGVVIPITHARESFWLNPLTWAMSAVAAFLINFLMKVVNP
jgi:hypothetical protein